MGERSVKPRPTVMIIDGDRGARRLLRQVLEPQAYRVVEADSGQHGLERATHSRPDLVILDLELPDTDGLCLLESMREWSRAAIIVLSARSREADKVAALDAGANDFITKPFGSAELLARLRVLQRTVPWLSDGPVLVEGGVSINLASHEVRLNGQPVKLTPTEEALLYVLVRYAGKVVSSNHLIRCLWGAGPENKTQELHVYIGNLRRKLQNSGEGIRIKTEGPGYKLPLQAEGETEFGGELTRAA